MTVPLHPILQAMLDKGAGLPPMQSFTPTEIRATDMARYAKVPRPAVGHVEDRMIPGPRGDIRIRIYRPDMNSGHPVVTYFHGSGFVICSIDTHDGLCRQICLRAGAVVVSVDYALAPENKFPAGPDDCLAATLWVSEHASNFGGDASAHVLVGDSAGGTMAIVTAMRMRQETAPAVKAQILMYPVTDYPDPPPHSYVERGNGFGLTADAMRYFWAHYLNEPADGAQPHASPMRAANLTGLPATYIMTADYDPLRDEGDEFAAKLADAKVDTTLVRYDDMNHGFMSWVGLLDRADEALDAVCLWLKTRL